MSIISLRAAIFRYTRRDIVSLLPSTTTFEAWLSLRGGNFSLSSDSKTVKLVASASTPLDIDSATLASQLYDASQGPRCDYVNLEHLDQLAQPCVDVSNTAETPIEILDDD